MRVRPLPLLVAVFAAAAAVAAFVVSQLPIEGAWSPPAAAPVAAAPAETSPALAPAPADGSVEVRVTVGGEPLAGAEVRLYLGPDAAAPLWRRAGTALTDRAGLASLPARPGAYLVAARAAGLAPGRAEVTRAPGEALAHAEVALEPPSTLEGRVVSRDGRPVAGARVRAVPLVSRWPGLAAPTAPPEETAVATADDSGAFRLDGLSPGAVTLAFEAEGRHPVSLRRVGVPGDALPIVMEPLGAIEGLVRRRDGRPAPRAVVSAASSDHGARATAGADGRFRLAAPAGRYVVHAAAGDEAGAAAAPVAIAAGEAAQGVEVRLGPAAAIDGVVLRAGGAPAAGAEVVILSHDTRELAARTVAGTDGRFAAGGLAPGAYDVRAAAPGASPARLRAVTVAAGARFPLRLTLPDAGAVAGTVRDPAGRPLAGVRVRAVPAGADPLATAAPVEARTDFEGRYRLAGLEAGAADVVAWMEGVLAGASRHATIAGGGTTSLDLVLPEAGLLAGRVHADGRRPPPGTTVVAVTRSGALQVARAAADASGNYRLVLPAGEYRVHAAPGHAASEDVRATPAFARVEPRRTTSLDLAFAPTDPAGGVEILVLEPGGAPSPGAVVTLARKDDGRAALATTAGEDGRVVVAAEGIAGREVTIRARNGGRTGAETLALPEAGTVTVRLAPGGAIACVARGAGGSPLTVEVASQPAAGVWRTLDVHRFAGERFELADLPPERLRIAVRSADGRRGATEVEVAPGERRAVEIALR